MGRNGEAEAAQRRALKLLPLDDRSSISWTIRNDLALTLRDLGRAEEALELFREVSLGVENTHQVSRAKRNLAVILMTQGRLEEARVHLEEAVAAQLDLPIPDWGLLAWLYENLTTVCERLGDKAAADEYRSQMAEIDWPLVY
jgi:tetratricopeptide (TPR) repeat protein